MSASKVVVFLLLVSVISQKPNCPDQEEVFVAQPSDVVVMCGSDEPAEFKCQHTLGSGVNAVWIVNSTAYGYGYRDFPDLMNHAVTSTHNGTLLSLESITLKQNNTAYQCQLEVYHHKTPCTYQSNVGRLILRGCGAPAIKFSAHYEYKNPVLATLKGISTTITKRAPSNHTSYTVTYSDSISSTTCDLVTFPSSSCIDGVCSHTFNVSSKRSRCSKSSDILVTVTMKGTKGRILFQSEPHIIDSLNNFIKVSFDKVTSSISLKFLDQPKASMKYYLVKYGIRTPAGNGCKDLPLHVEGHLSNSNLISLELNLNLKEIVEVCFAVTVNNGTKTMSVEGIYKTDSNDGSTSTIPVPLHAFRFILLVTLSNFGALVIFALVIVHRRPKRIQSRSENTTGEEESNIKPDSRSENMSDCNSVRDAAFDREKLSQDVSSELKKIDKSTTFFGLHIVTEKCLMENFARKYYKGYQPTKGFGYYELANPDDKLDPSWNVILTDEKNEPIFSAFGSAVVNNQESKTRWKHVYVQSKSVETKLAPGDRFLYCACSESVTAYQEEHDVLEACKESEFVKTNIKGYQNEWFRYCYFEFNKPTYIKPHQKVIVKKKTGELMTGAGVRQLIGATGDGSQLVQPPSFTENPEWERVFIQSKDLDRTLQPGSKYLFCAMMDRVRETVHYDVYNIRKSCNMAKCARHHIPGFKPELGYGYYELKQEEVLEPEKKVILVDKKNRLFTGAGARFFRTGGGYRSDDIRKKKYPPPNLDGTQWKHIFIQSHSDKRELLADSKFLYFEYQTHQ